MELYVVHALNLKKRLIIKHKVSKITKNNIIKLKTENYLKYLSEFTGIPVKIIKSEKRNSETADARKIFSVFLYIYTDMSLSEIGEIMNINHSTVLYNCKHAYLIWKEFNLFREFLLNKDIYVPVKENERIKNVVIN